MSILPDGKETKAMVQQTTRETNAIMQLMANNVSEVMSSWFIKPRLGRVFTLDSGNQWRHDLRKWFSSPDPSTNHIILCRVQHQGTADWFFRGSLFEEWKSTGSLFWIHGKRASFTVARYPLSDVAFIVAGSGKSVIWCVVSSVCVLVVT